MASRELPPPVALFPRGVPASGPAMAAAVEAPVQGPDLLEEIAALGEGLTESLALLHAIDLGELLSALPPGGEDRRRHETAVALLAIQNRLLEDLLSRCQKLQVHD